MTSVVSRRSRGARGTTKVGMKGTMAKKRVYELAKDLGLSNKEMVDWLKSHEYDVKSHSSSLEDDQALAVTEKILGERSPRPAAPKPPSSGVVLRRKKADTLGPDGQPLGEHFEPPPPPPPPVVEVRAEPPAPAPEIRPELARPPEPVVAPPPAAAPPAQAVAPAPEPEQKPEPAVSAAPVFVPPPPPAPARPEPVKPPQQRHVPHVPARA